MILGIILDLLESFLEFASLLRPLRFDFTHWGVIPGNLEFYFWPLHVRPYNRIFIIGLRESDFFR